MNLFFEQGREPIRGNKALEWVRVRGKDPRALVFVPPLVGGTVAQQVKSFRGLVRAGLDLFTFNYSGHGNSTGLFSLGASLRDVHTMLFKAHGVGEREGLPLLGVATCYSAIPFLRAIARFSEPLERLVLINAISRLSATSVLRSFWGYYRNILSTARGPVSVRTAMIRYAEVLFPGVVKHRNAFGVLKRSRARLSRTVSEFLTMDPLRNIRLKNTPTLCLYATNDPVLEIFTTQSWSSYRAEIRRICPDSTFYLLEGDHFLSQPATKDRATELIFSFFTSGRAGTAGYNPPFFNAEHIRRRSIFAGACEAA